jgi:hypothetical protein
MHALVLRLVVALVLLLHHQPLNQTAASAGGVLASQSRCCCLLLSCWMLPAVHAVPAPARNTHSDFAVVERALQTEVKNELHTSKSGNCCTQPCCSHLLLLQALRQQR